MELGTEDASGSQDLYRSDTLVVRQVATGDRDRWVVTFDNYGIGHGFDRPGFGEEWLKAQGVSAIHVMGRAEDWYQYEDIDAALATVREAVRGATRVMTYGSSMGGYAAVRFADAAGAHVALALSPQYTLDPAVAGHDGRWSQDVDRIRWIPRLNGPLRLDANVIVVLDPMSPDGWHGRRIVEDTGAATIGLPHTAHPTTSFLSDIGRLAPLVMSTLDGSLDPRAFRREARARRTESGTYFGELALKQPAHRLQTALSVARLGVATHPLNLHARVALSRLLGRAGLHEEALEHLDFLTNSSDRSVVYLVEQGYGLALAGRRADSRAIVDEVLARHDKVAHLYGWAAAVHWANRDAAEARRMIATAIRLDPGQAFYRTTSDLYNRRKSIWTRLSDWASRHTDTGRRGTTRLGRFMSPSEPATGS